MSEEHELAATDGAAGVGARIERVGERLHVTLQADTLDHWSTIVSDAVAQTNSATPEGECARLLAEALNSGLAPGSPMTFEAVSLERPPSQKTGVRAHQLREALGLLGCATGLAIAFMIVFRGIVAWWKDIFG